MFCVILLSFFSASILKRAFFVVLCLAIYAVLQVSIGNYVQLPESLVLYLRQLVVDCIVDETVKNAGLYVIDDEWEGIS